eukprot:COSAG01_NODE_542_length_15693_cov_13.246253_6_plen_112_part_00
MAWSCLPYCLAPVCPRPSPLVLAPAFPPPPRRPAAPAVHHWCCVLHRRLYGRSQHGRVLKGGCLHLSVCLFLPAKWCAIATTISPTYFWLTIHLLLYGRCPPQLGAVFLRV